ncbi:MAG: nucleotide exchange factor GrpE [Patescibacteria group bacterium]
MDKNFKKIKEELELVQKQSAEHLAGWQRARADYSNLKKDFEKREMEIVGFANAMFMAEVLPIYRHFKLALKHIPEDQKKLEWVKGIELIGKQFKDFLARHKIEEIKTVGEKFDHNIHEAVAHEEKEGADSETIFEEVSPGYLLDGKVIMPAKVRVAK